LQDLHRTNPSKYPAPEINEMLEFEWNLFLGNKRKVGQNRGILTTLSVCVFVSLQAESLECIHADLDTWTFLKFSCFLLFVSLHQLI